MKKGYRLAVSLTMAVTGWAQAQTGMQYHAGGGSGQTCLHRTADGRCVHWSSSSAGSSPEPARSHDQDRRPAQSSTTSGCMRNPSSGANQMCFHITADGTCVHFGGACN